MGGTNAGAAGLEELVRLDFDFAAVAGALVTAGAGLRAGAGALTGAAFFFATTTLELFFPNAGLDALRGAWALAEGLLDFPAAGRLLEPFFATRPVAPFRVTGEMTHPCEVPSAEPAQRLTKPPTHTTRVENRKDIGAYRRRQSDGAKQEAAKIVNHAFNPRITESMALRMRLSSN